MKKNALRQQAEAKLGKQKKTTLPPTELETQRLLHELQVHQIELELQNEELVQARAEAEALHRQFTDLYDFAPVGYFTLARDGTISRVNLTGAALLAADAERGKLLNRRFGLFVAPAWRPVFAAFLEKVFISGKKETCEVELLRGKTGSFWAQIEAVSEYAPDRAACRAVLVDISARKQADEALRASEDKFKYVFEHASVGKSLTLPTGEINVNQALCDMLGYTLPEFKNKKFQEITHPDDIDLSQREMDQLLSGKRDVARFVKRFLHKDGSVVWADLSSSIRREADGSPLYLMTTIVDITERVQAESFIKDIIAKNPMSIQVLDKDGFTLEANPAHKALFGSVPPADYSIFNDPQLAQKGMGAIFDQLRNGEVVHFPDVRYNPHDSIPEMPDVPAWVRTIGFPIRDSHGKPERFILMHENMTARKQAEDALKQSETLYRKMIENSPLGMHFYTLNHNDQLTFVGANPAADTLLGVDHARFVGKTLAEAFPPLMQTEVPARYRDAAAKGIPWSTEQIAYEDQQITGAFDVRAFQTTPGNMVAVFANITARKQAEDALRESENTVRTWVNAIQESALMMDLEGHLLAVNATTAQRLHRTVAEMVGKCIYDYLPAQVASERRLHVAQVIETGQPVRFEDERSGRAIDNFIYPVFDADGRLTRLAILGTDITTRKQAEEALLQKIDELERWQSLTVGRELKMIELKKEVNALLEQAGQPQEYKIVAGKPE